MNKRFIWADVIRIVAIYLIVVLHIINIPSPKKADFIFFIDLSLIHTCVPLMVMLSGSLLLRKVESYSTFFRKRVSRVVIPWITWTCIFTLITAISQTNFSVGNVVYIFHQIFIPFFWFIILVCALYLLTPALRLFVKKAKMKDIFFVVLLWFLAVCVLPYIRNTQAFPLQVDNGIVRLVIDFIGYFLIGFLIIKTQLKKNYLPLAIAIFVTSVLVTSAVGYYLAHWTMNYSFDVFDYISPGIVIVSVSLFFILYLAENSYQKSFTTFIKKGVLAGSNATLGIYFVHYLFLNRPPLPYFIQSPNVLHVSPDVDLFINGFIFFIISFVIIYLLQKIPFIKSIVT
jgi:surface polysaccharide O-acyltransferase-like enzyme